MCPRSAITLDSQTAMIVQTWELANGLTSLLKITCANMTPTFGAVVTPKWCQCNTMGATVTPYGAEVTP